MMVYRLSLYAFHLPELVSFIVIRTEARVVILRLSIKILSGSQSLLAVSHPDLLKVKVDPWSYWQRLIEGLKSALVLEKVYCTHFYVRIVLLLMLRKLLGCSLELRTL